MTMTWRARVNVATRWFARASGKSGSKISGQGHSSTLASASALADLHELSTLLLALASDTGISETKPGTPPDPDGRHDRHGRSWSKNAPGVLIPTAFSNDGSRDH